MPNPPSEPAKKDGENAAAQREQAPQQAPQQQQQDQARTAQQAAAQPQQAAERRAAADAGNARTAGNSRDLARGDEHIGPVSPTRARAIELGREAARRSRAPVLPTAAELDRIRDKHFGGKPGTVRVDAPPEGSGPDSPPTKLIFFDADGRKAGERDYTGPDEE